MLGCFGIAVTSEVPIFDILQAWHDETPLHMAALEGNELVARILIEEGGADVNIPQKVSIVICCPISWKDRVINICLFFCSRRAKPHCTMRQVGTEIGL